MFHLEGCNFKLPPHGNNTGPVKAKGRETRVEQLTLRVAGPDKAARIHILFRHDHRVFMITRPWISGHKKKSDKHGNGNYAAGAKELRQWQDAGGELW